MLERRRGKDKVVAEEEPIDLEALEDELTEARSVLAEAEKHNNILQGRISAAYDELNKKGFKTIKAAESKANEIESRVKKELPKLKRKLEKFYQDFDALKEALP